jgi:general secretion pathway protein N
LKLVRARAMVAAGLLAGAGLALLLAAPAAWLASAVASASGQRLLLADARGTVWNGSALAVLTGGPGSRDASTLPGRLHWRLGLDSGGLVLNARQACCISGDAVLRVQPGWGGTRLQFAPAAGSAAARGAAPAAVLVGQWPAAWLVGLGTPWNTLQPSGLLRLRSDGLTLDSGPGRLSFGGRAELDLDDIASRISTLDVLGSYRLELQGPTGDGGGDSAALRLSTRSGALQLSGNGQWSPQAAPNLRFRGEARAAPGAETVLNNLLNIIGRRQGAAAVISIG